MEQKLNEIIHILRYAGLFAPLIFIALHVLRQFLFIPIGLICVIGGLLFGSLSGSLYSIIGITLSSIMFYGLRRVMPKMFSKITGLKNKWIGKRIPFSLGQITILKLIPFVHFQLLSYCLIEMTSDFKEYTKASLISNIPVAIAYTTFGNYILHLSLLWGGAALAVLSILFYLLRRKEWIFKWNEFFEREDKEEVKHVKVRGA
ncbi:VTT domain-containing protein [Fictibacillus sp. Mic-4]|uniref:TVP38/TMEM64 family protein n=1 Tax=Fictibacillus TaxID=1329200 RepID=UPI00041507B5|nr:VTT domain-containing protein [Fictibacillus gelatini]